MSSIETEARKQKFLLAAAKFTTIDDPIMRRMKPEHRPDQSTLGEATAKVIRGLRYAEVSITSRSGICHFEATTHNQHQIQFQCRENQVETMFATCGIDDYLHATLEHPGTIQNQVRHACRRTWRNHPPILEKTHSATVWTDDRKAPDPPDPPGSARGYAASLDGKHDPSRTR